jgi:hypothetical protein
MTLEDSKSFDFQTVQNKMKSTVWFIREEGLGEALKHIIDLNPQ